MNNLSILCIAALATLSACSQHTDGNYYSKEHDSVSAPMNADENAAAAGTNASGNEKEDIRNSIERNENGTIIYNAYSVGTGIEGGSK